MYILLISSVFNAADSADDSNDSDDEFQICQICSGEDVLCFNLDTLFSLRLRDFNNFFFFMELGKEEAAPLF